MMNTDTEEYNLAVRARDGDLEALSELVERGRLSLFGIAYAELGHYEDAQDVLIASLHRICLHISDLQEPARVRSWMWSIVRNEVRQFRRSRQMVVSGDSLESISSVDTSLLPCLMRVDVERALRQLPQDQAQVIVLFYWQHLSTQEIARQLERPEGTIRRWPCSS